MYRPLRPVYPRSRRSPRLAGNIPFLIVRFQTKSGGFVRYTADGNIVPPTAAGSHGVAPGGRSDKPSKGWNEGDGESGASTPGAVDSEGDSDVTGNSSGGKGGYLDAYWMVLQHVRGLVFLVATISFVGGYSAKVFGASLLEVKLMLTPRRLVLK